VAGLAAAAEACGAFETFGSGRNLAEPFQVEGPRQEHRPCRTVGPTAGSAAAAQAFWGPASSGDGRGAGQLFGRSHGPFTFGDFAADHRRRPCWRSGWRRRGWHRRCWHRRCWHRCCWHGCCLWRFGGQRRGDPLREPRLRDSQFPQPLVGVADRDGEQHAALTAGKHRLGPRPVLVVGRAGDAFKATGPCAGAGGRPVRQALTADPPPTTAASKMNLRRSMARFLPWTCCCG
jgi:hypothetical protein